MKARIIEAAEALLSENDQLRGRIADLEEERDRLRYALNRTNESWHEDYGRVKALTAALARLVGDDPSPCRLDHHNFCQEHCFSAPCAFDAARRLLAAQEASGG